MPTAECSRVAESRWLQETCAFSGKKRKEAPGQQRKPFLLLMSNNPLSCVLPLCGRAVRAPGCSRLCRERCPLWTVFHAVFGLLTTGVTRKKAGQPAGERVGPVYNFSPGADAHHSGDTFSWWQHFSPRVKGGFSAPGAKNPAASCARLTVTWVTDPTDKDSLQDRMAV